MARNTNADRADRNETEVAEPVQRIVEQTASKQLTIVEHNHVPVNKSPEDADGVLSCMLTHFDGGDSKITFEETWRTQTGRRQKRVIGIELNAENTKRFCDFLMTGR